MPPCCPEIRVRRFQWRERCKLAAKMQPITAKPQGAFWCGGGVAVARGLLLTWKNVWVFWCSVLYEELFGDCPCRASDWLLYMGCRVAGSKGHPEHCTQNPKQ